MHTLSLPQKIGQLLIAGFDGHTVNSHIAEMIRDYHIGGVIMFARNIASPEQINTLTIQLQQLNTHTQHPLPLMISIDQEGGMVARIESGITYLPGAMALAATQSTQGVQEIYRAVGQELRALGIHVNFAPVADVNSQASNPVIGVRSFGEQAQQVSRLMQQAMQGLKEAQIVAVVKHFPGHGDTTVDSHIGLPYIAHDINRLDTVELLPFCAAINVGVAAIMTAHVIVPALDARNLPCTLSYPVLTTLLRKKLGFTGVIVTDCLEMNAIAAHYGVVEGAVQAFEAGADILLISHTQTHQIRFIETMLQHVASGRISEARIDASVQRIAALKIQYHMQEVCHSPLRAPQAVALSTQLSQSSITLVQDRASLLPINATLKTLVITAQVGKPTEIDALIRQGSLGTHLKAEITECDEIFIDANTNVEESQYVLQVAAEYTQIIVMSYNAILWPTQANLINTLAQQHPYLIVVAGRLPYDLQSLPDISTFLAAYENRSEAMLSAANILLGKVTATGKLPVTV